jgi:hypothetical protein
MSLQMLVINDQFEIELPINEKGVHLIGAKNMRKDKGVLHLAKI